LDAECGIIGVNNRDLKTFKVDLATALRLAEEIPKGALAVAESGMENGVDIARLRAAGYGAFLIGETLMKATAPGEVLRGLMADATASVSSAR
jgi:indole-3-glycerol phosphate synthase